MLLKLLVVNCRSLIMHLMRKGKYLLSYNVGEKSFNWANLSIGLLLSCSALEKRGGLQ